MVSLKLQKRLASSVLKCVRHRSWNNSPREASSCITEGVEFIARSYPNPSTSPRHRTPSILPKTISPWATLPKKIEAYDPDPKERFTAAMQQCLQIFGPNKMEEKEKSKFLGFMWNPLSWVMEAAVIMAIALANGGFKIGGSRRIGRTLSASPPCLLSTPPSDSSRRPMPATPPPRSWPVSCPKPRFFATAGGPMKTWPSSCQGTSSASSSMTSYLQMHLSWSETSQDWSGPSPAKKRLISLP